MFWTLSLEFGRCVLIFTQKQEQMDFLFVFTTLLLIYLQAGKEQNATFRIDNAF